MHAARWWATGRRARVRTAIRETCVVHYLRTGVRQRYGVDSDVLVAFDMVPTPRRVRATKRKAAKSAAEVPVSEPVVPETAK